MHTTASKSYLLRAITAWAVKGNRSRFGSRVNPPRICEKKLNSLDHNSLRHSLCDVWMRARHLLKRHLANRRLSTSDETVRFPVSDRPRRPAHCSSNLGHWSEPQVLLRHAVKVARHGVMTVPSLTRVRLQRTGNLLRKSQVSPPAERSTKSQRAMQAG